MSNDELFFKLPVTDQEELVRDFNNLRKTKAIEGIFAGIETNLKKKNKKLDERTRAEIEEKLSSVLESYDVDSLETKQAEIAKNISDKLYSSRTFLSRFTFSLKLPKNYLGKLSSELKSSLQNNLVNSPQNEVKLPQNDGELFALKSKNSQLFDTAIEPEVSHRIEQRAAVENKAAIKVQKVARGRSGRKQAAAERASKQAAENKAAIKIQKVARGVAVRKQAAAERANKQAAENKAAIKIQKVARGVAARKQAATENKAENKAAIQIQKVARGVAVRKQAAENHALNELNKREETRSNLLKKDIIAPKETQKTKDNQVRDFYGKILPPPPDKAPPIPPAVRVARALEKSGSEVMKTFTKGVTKFQALVRGEQTRDRLYDTPYPKDFAEKHLINPKYSVDNPPPPPAGPRPENQTGVAPNSPRSVVEINNSDSRKQLLGDIVKGKGLKKTEVATKPINSRTSLLQDIKKTLGQSGLKKVDIKALEVEKAKEKAKEKVELATSVSSLIGDSSLVTQALEQNENKKKAQKKKVVSQRKERNERVKTFLEEREWGDVPEGNDQVNNDAATIIQSSLRGKMTRKKISSLSDSMKALGDHSVEDGGSTHRHSTKKDGVNGIKRH